MIHKLIYGVVILAGIGGCTTNSQTFSLSEFDKAEEFVAQMTIIGNKVNKNSPSREFYYNDRTRKFDTLYVVKYNDY